MAVLPLNLINHGSAHMNEQQRSNILAEVARLTGERIHVSFLLDTAPHISGVSRLISRARGIYKPAGWRYVLSIRMTLNSQYEAQDAVHYLPDGRWVITYAPRAGGLDLDDNAALVRCMTDRQPVALFKQLSTKHDREHGASYLVLGLGLLTSYDAASDVFVVESVDQASLRLFSSGMAEDVREELLMYTGLANKFQLFAPTALVTHTSTQEQRKSAFQRVIMQAYNATCAVCEMRFRLGSLVEANAAHIVPKAQQGTDDPRNGLLLCRSHHWAFDAGLFALSDDLRVKVSTVMAQADTQNFQLAELVGKPILLPSSPALQPHPIAVGWHRQNVWRG